jgi:CRISPR-associated protein Cmr3
MSILNIFAYDSLFVRDGKPFSMGEDTWASGIFPPPPSVFYGAIRTRYFSENPEEINSANTTNDPTESLEISRIGFLLKKGASVERIYPAPYDMVTNEDISPYNPGHIMLLQYNENTQGTSSAMPLLEIQHADNIEVQGGMGFFDEIDFDRYLNGEVPYQVTPSSMLWTTEPKIGIAKDRFTGSSQQGKLYRSGMIRPEVAHENHGLSQFGFWLETKGLNKHIAPHGHLKLGGEGKMALYNTTEQQTLTIEAPKPAGNRLKIYFASPAIFKDGYLPDTSQGIWLKHKIRVITVASGKPVLIGGFSMKKDKHFGPKPMRKALPAGSVFFIEIGGDVAAAIKDIHGQCISDEFSPNDQPSKQGFGLAYIALSNHQNF